MFASKLKSGLVVPVVLAMLLTGCANTQSKVSQERDTKNTLESGVAQANIAQAEGRTDEAVSVLKVVASRFPTDKTPWVRLAQIRFDVGDYSDAIVNAQEALKRDPADKAANGIVVVSGLRLAAKSLGDLRSQNALNGSIKSDVQELTKILRESLGEIPPAAVPVKVAPRPRGKSANKATSATGADSGNSGSGSGPNPFGNLK